MDDFAVRALLAGIGVAVVAAPFGSFVVWRRMAYFGDALAHAALLGIALGLVLGIGLDAGVIAVCTAVAVGIVVLQRNRQLAGDTLIGIFAHGALASGVLALALLEGVRIDLLAYLFGDVLAVAPRDLLWIYGGGAVVLGVLARLWRPLVALAVDEELAAVEGVPVTAVTLALVALMAVVIAFAMKIVGALLITAMLILPAAATRRLARTPEEMAIGAAAVGAVAVALGLGASFAWDAPAGPAIVLSALALFVASLAVPARGRRREDA